MSAKGNKSSELTTNFGALNFHLPSLSNSLERCEESNIRGRDTGIDSGISGDLVSSDIRQALHHLGSITGEISTEDLLGNIFGKFCIGEIKPTP